MSSHRVARTSRRALLILVILAAWQTFAQKDPVARSWNQPVAPFRIAGNIYYVGASDVTSYLITTPKGHFLIDGGFEETAPMILANIAKLGFRATDVRFLLASHAHYDHAGGLAALKRATGAKLVASRGEALLFARGGLDDPQFRDKYPFPPITADQTFDDGAGFTLGRTTLVARVTPGHTPGCTTWTTTIRDGNRSYVVVILGSPSVPSEYVLTTNPRYPNAVADYRRQFAILCSLHPDIWLAAHGGVFNLTAKMKTHNFVDPAGYAAFVDKAQQWFEKRVATEAGSHDATTAPSQ